MKTSFLTQNLAADTDSYKIFHEPMYPANTQASHCYFGGRTRGELLSFSMLQPQIQHYLIDNPVTVGDIEEMVDLVPKHIMGREFLRKGWDKIVNVHGGYAPLRIKAAPEGLIIPSGNVLLTCESTDPDLFFLPGYIEPWMERLWAAITAGTKSWRIKQMMRHYLEASSDNPEEALKFMLHDFGCRGGDSQESVAMVGAAHLQHFYGTDTIPALRLLRKFYGCDMAGYSVVASEHAVMSAKGRAGEAEQFDRVFDLATPGSTVSIVGDTYSIFNFVNTIVRSRQEKIIKSGARLVVRPDSSQGIEDTCDIIYEVLVELAKIFGCVTNDKGYEVINPCARVLWGDGNNEENIAYILANCLENDFSAENLVFGMGGELHANMTRDTHKFAYKSSAQLRDGAWHDVFKDPITDPGKSSFKGLMSLYKGPEGYVSLSNEQFRSLPLAQKMVTGEVLETVYLNGTMPKRYTFDEVRANAAL